jgi:hypothetical protein
LSFQCWASPAGFFATQLVLRIPGTSRVGDTRAPVFPSFPADPISSPLRFPCPTPHTHPPSPVSLSPAWSHHTHTPRHFLPCASTNNPRTPHQGAASNAVRQTPRTHTAGSSDTPGDTAERSNRGSKGPVPMVLFCVFSPLGWQGPGGFNVQSPFWYTPKTPFFAKVPGVSQPKSEFSSFFALSCQRIFKPPGPSQPKQSTIKKIVNLRKCAHQTKKAQVRIRPPKWVLPPGFKKFENLRQSAS